MVNVHQSQPLLHVVLDVQLESVKSELMLCTVMNVLLDIP